MLKILCVFHKKCDKWADHGKQLKPSQIDSYYVLKNNQWCPRCEHVFCFTIDFIMCRNKHDYESIELKGNISMKDDLSKCQKRKRAPMFTFDELHCVIALLEELKYNVLLEVARGF